MNTDWLDESMNEEQRQRYRSCWVLICESDHKTFTLRPYLYEQFFAPDAQHHAAPMILDVLSLLTDGCPLLISFRCQGDPVPAAYSLSACAEAFGDITCDASSPSFLLRPQAFPRELLGAFLYDPESAFHVVCTVPMRYLLDRFDHMPYSICNWYLQHGLSRMELNYLSGRPMLEIHTDGSLSPQFLMGRIAPMLWRHGFRLVQR